MAKHRIPEGQLYPVMVYKSPGDQSGPDGTTFKYKAVDKAVDLESALEYGWHLKLEDAVGVESDAEPAPVNQLAIDLAAIPADSAPATRPELERKAQELGIEGTQPLSDYELEQFIGQRLADIADPSDSPSGTEEDKQRKESEKGRVTAPASKKAKG